MPLNCGQFLKAIFGRIGTVKCENISAFKNDLIKDFGPVRGAVRGAVRRPVQKSVRGAVREPIFGLVRGAVRDTHLPVRSQVCL